MSTPENWCQPDTETEDSGLPRDPRVSSLCRKGWQPLLITGLLRDLLIRHFANPASIENDDLLRSVWQNDQRTGILIESVHRWKGDMVGKRPAVLLKRNAYRSRKHVINDFSGQTEDGSETFNVHWAGSHTVFCIHGTGASTEILATEVQRELTQFSPVVRSELNLHNFAVMEVGAVSEIEESTENFVVPITIGWIYQESWVLKSPALPLRRILLSTLLDVPSPSVPKQHTSGLTPQQRQWRTGTRRPGP